jgi:uncharacterized protein (UPF0335 family)
MDTNNNSTKQKIVGIAIASLFTLGLAGWGVSQLYSGKQQSQKINAQQLNMQSLTTSLQNEMVAKEQLIARINVLEDENATLRQEVTNLKNDLQARQQAIKNIEAKLNALMAENANLKNNPQQATEANQEVFAARGGNAVESINNNARIAELIQERTKLISEVDQLTQNQTKLNTELQTNKQKLADSKVNEMRLLRLNNIVQNTRIEYQNIALRKTREGKSVNKVQTSGDHWQYTVANLQLKNADNSMVVDENFVLKVVDAITQEPIPNIEINAAFASKEASGASFKYAGKPIEVVHFNDSRKLGKHYDIKIFYRFDDKEYLLSYGTVSVVKDGKAIFL